MAERFRLELEFELRMVRGSAELDLGRCGSGDRLRAVQGMQELLDLGVPQGCLEVHPLVASGSQRFDRNVELGAQARSESACIRRAGSAISLVASVQHQLEALAFFEPAVLQPDQGLDTWLRHCAFSPDIGGEKPRQTKRETH